MKYAVFTKKIGELDVSDFDEEVVNQYENITLKDVGLSCTVNGQEVITTIDNIIQDMCEKQIDYIFDAFAERIAKKINEVPQQEPSKEYDYSKWKIRVVGGFDQHAEYTCPICGITIADQSFKLNYCPNCGTRMEGNKE